MRPFAIRLAAAVLFAALFASTALAGGDPQTHDGFFLRLSPGVGNASTRIDVTGFKIDASDFASDGDIAIGGCIQPNLALHGTLFGWSMSNPNADVTVPVLGTANGSLNGTLFMGAVGVGLTYYFMPSNFYATGTAGWGRLRLEGNNDVDGETKNGFATELGLGKEWWVGDSWGLGLAAGLTYHSLPDKDVDENWSGVSYSLRFSATLN